MKAKKRSFFLLFVCNQQQIRNPPTETNIITSALNNYIYLYSVVNYWASPFWHLDWKSIVNCISRKHLSPFLKFLIKNSYILCMCVYTDAPCQTHCLTPKAAGHREIRGELHSHTSLTPIRHILPGNWRPWLAGARFDYRIEPTIRTSDARLCVCRWCRTSSSELQSAK